MCMVISFIQQWTLGGASVFWLLWMPLLWTQRSNISLRPCFQIFRFHTQKWNCNHIVLNFLRDPMPFSTVAAPFHIPANGVGGFHSLHSLTHTHFLLFQRLEGASPPISGPAPSRELWLLVLRVCPELPRLVLWVPGRQTGFSLPGGTTDFAPGSQRGLLAPPGAQRSLSHPEAV